jgi:hypothetical protein
MTPKQKTKTKKKQKKFVKNAKSVEQKPFQIVI